MSTIVLWSKKVRLVFVITALFFLSIPLGNAYAMAPSDTTPTPANQKSVDRLEQAWAREQIIYAKLGTFLNSVDQRIANGQELIDKAKANGKDTSALQTALDNFSTAVKLAKPVYQVSIGIVSSHTGFEGNGNVTDPLQAFNTVRGLGENFREIRQLLAGPGRALRDAIKAFREANRPTPTPDPAQSGG